MKCPSCGAHNPESAEWCSQCYARLVEEAPAPTVARDAAGAGQAPDSDASAVDERMRGLVSQPIRPLRPGEIAGAALPGAAVEEPAAPRAAVSAPPTAGEGIARTDAGLVWSCAVCETSNPMAAAACASCGTTFARSLALRRDAERPVDLPERSETAIMLASVALPGLGHLLLHRYAAGVVRVSLYLFWLAGALALLASSGSVLPAVPLLLGMLALLGTSPLDAANAHRGSSNEILGPRTLLWLVVGVIGLTMLFGTALLFTGRPGDGGAGTGQVDTGDTGDTGDPGGDPAPDVPTDVASPPADGAVTAPTDGSGAGSVSALR